MRAEMPYVAAGGVAFVGGAIRAKGWPDNGWQAILATAGIGIIASAANGSRIAPIVRALGLLILLSSVMSLAKSLPGQSPPKWNGEIPVGSRPNSTPHVNTPKK